MNEGRAKCVRAKVKPMEKETFALYMQRVAVKKIRVLSTSFSFHVVLKVCKLLCWIACAFGGAERRTNAGR